MTVPSDSVPVPSPVAHPVDLTGVVQRRILELGLLPPGALILVGISGGVDSMVLLSLLKSLGYGVQAVHVNYGLRGKASDQDAEFVTTSCLERGVPLEVVDASRQMRDRPSGSSVQGYARDVRYDHFHRLALSGGVEYVAVGHHMNDQAETVLLNLYRGTGLDGMAGMRPMRSLRVDSNIRLVRPLLSLRREDITDFAKRERTPWREDESNASLKYRRGKIRNVIIPELEKAGGGDIVSELADFAEHMAGFVDDVLIGLLPPGLRDAHCDSSSEERLIQIASLKRLPEEVRAWLLLRALRRWIPGAPVRRSSVKALAGLIDGPVGKRIQYGSGSVWRERGVLRFIQERPDDGVEHSESLDIDGSCTCAAGHFTAERVTGKVSVQSTDRNEILVDADRLKASLSIRRWRAGDRFRPLGMQGTKRVKSFLTDEKVPPSERASVHVLCEGDRIMWVIGYRMSDDYRLTGDTRSIVRIRRIGWTV